MNLSIQSAVPVNIITICVFDPLDTLWISHSESVAFIFYRIDWNLQLKSMIEIKSYNLFTHKLEKNWISFCPCHLSYTTRVNLNLSATNKNNLLSASVFFSLDGRGCWARCRVIVVICSHVIVEIFIFVITLSTATGSDLFFRLLQLLPGVTERFGKMIVDRHCNCGVWFAGPIDNVDTGWRCILWRRRFRRWRRFIFWIARRWCRRLWRFIRFRLIRQRWSLLFGRWRCSWTQMFCCRLSFFSEQIHVISTQRTSEMFIDNWIDHGNRFRRCGIGKW